MKFAMSNKQLRKLPKVAMTFAAFMSFCYLGYHALASDRGLLKMIKLNQEIEKHSFELSSLKSERTSLERRVSLISNSPLDGDIVDEQIRLNLGYAGKDEVMVLTVGK